MPRYLIERDITRASGAQYFYVDAEDEEEAIKKHKNGEGDMYSSECEATALGEPEIAGTVDDDDCGD